jgi:sensor histidine kinase regulating citrate/malate metabolism
MKFHDNQESTGIGLYLVYNHITSLGGRIAVE